MILKLCIYKKQNEEIHLLTRNLSISMNIFGSAAFLFGAIALLFSFGSIWWRPFHILFSTFLSIAICNIYMYLVIRLKSSFEGSIYEIPKVFLYSYYGILVIIVTLSIIASMLMAIGYYIAFISVLSLIILITILVCIHIAYSFNKRLFKLVKSVDSEIDTGNELGAKQLELVGSITKHTLIITAGIFAFAIPTIISLIVTIATFKNGFFIGLITFVYAMIPALVITSILLFIGFPSMQKWYDLCCGKCNEWMEGCCKDLAKKKLTKTQPNPIARIVNSASCSVESVRK